MIEDRVREHLHGKAEQISVEVPRRTFEAPAPRRSWATPLSLAAAAAIVALVVGLPLMLLRGGAEPAPSPPATVVEVPPSEAPSLAWSLGELPDQDVTGIGRMGQAIVAWKSSLGTGKLEVWRSVDGATWERFAPTADLNTTSEVVYHVSGTSELLIAVGELVEIDRHETLTTPFVLTWDGADWSRTDLPEVLPAAEPSPGFYWQGGQPMVVAGERPLLIGVLTEQFEPHRLLEPRLAEFGLDPDEGFGVGIVGDTIELYGVAGELVATLTADELGLDPNTDFDVIHDIVNVHTYAYEFTDGDWVALDPTGLDAKHVAGVVAVDDGFLAIGVPRTEQFDHSSTTVWRSGDGETWMATGELPAWINGVAARDGVVVAVGEADNTAAIFVSSDDGESWGAISRDALSVDELSHTFAQTIVAGDGGFLAVGTSFRAPGEPAPVEIRKDGLIYRESPTEASYTVVDEITGNVLLRGAHERGRPSFEEGVMTVVAEDAISGEILMEITRDEYIEAQSAAGRDFGSQAGLLWFSPDGEAWSASRMDDVFDTGAGVPGLGDVPSAVSVDGVIAALYQRVESEHDLGTTIELAAVELWMGR